MATAGTAPSNSLLPPPTNENQATVVTPSTINSTIPQAPSTGHMTAVAPPSGPGGAGAPPTTSQQPPAQQYSTGPPTSGVTPGSGGATDPSSQSTGTMGGYGTTAGGGTYGGAPGSKGQPKRLHVSNIPFRFREPDLRHLFYVS